MQSSLILIDSIDLLRERIGSFKQCEPNSMIGFVPTMGSLHDGHMSLVESCVAENSLSVVSIFVNPTQFGPGMDYERYPRDLDSDIAKLKSAGVDLLFAPQPDQIYADDFCSWVQVEGLSDYLDGSSRPGYFKGICTVVLKLFNIVQAQRAYFGQKDIQQALILKKMVADLNLELDLNILPTVREENGLAMSSRNSYLSSENKESAALIYKGLCSARKQFEDGERDSSTLIETVKQEIAKCPQMKIDYVEVVDYEKLQPLAQVESKAVLALAVDFEGTRLIDNVVLGGGSR